MTHLLIRGDTMLIGQLGGYLALCVQRAEPIELVSFWADDEECPIEKYRHITFDELFNRSSILRGDN